MTHPLGGHAARSVLLSPLLWSLEELLALLGCSEARRLAMSLRWRVEAGADALARSRVGLVLDAGSGGAAGGLRRTRACTGGGAEVTGGAGLVTRSGGRLLG